MPARKNGAQLLSLLLLAFSLSLALAGCQRASQQPDAGQAADVSITFALDPDPALVGLTQAVVTLTGADGQPVAGATIKIKGDMSHAGMQPVLADAVEDAPGVYRSQFAWTMSGDWIVTVTATLPDGTDAAQQFELNVSR